MAIDTLMAFVGIYDSVEDAEAGHQLVKTSTPRLADAGEIERDANAAAESTS